MSNETPPSQDSAAPAGTGPRRYSRRARVLTLLASLAGLATLALGVVVVAGFLNFVERVVEMRVPDAAVKGDGIVVLTGGQQRIEHALDLLRSGAAKRLLISGVNPATTGTEIQRLTKSSKSLFVCCVDIGHDAIDTIGNAYETARWISERGYKRVFLVTNNYHMPRSLLELRRVDPETDFIPYPVINNDLKQSNWLGEPDVVRRLVSEYVKYTVASVRLMLGPPSDRGLRTDRTRASAAGLVSSVERAE